MDTADTVKEIIEGGLKWELLFTLFQLMLGAYVLMYLKSLIINEVAWRCFRGSSSISLGTWIRIPRATGYEDGQITSANRRRIAIKTKHGLVYMPMKTFPDRDWYLLDIGPTRGIKNGK